MLRKKSSLGLIFVMLTAGFFSCNQLTDSGSVVSSDYGAASRSSAAASAGYITQGSGSNIRIIGSAWTENSGYYVGSGTNNYAYANASINAGDFTISAVLQLDELERTAATFDMDGNRFGFDGREHQFFVEGPHFGSISYFGVSVAHIAPGEVFNFEVTRRGKTLSYKINHDEVWSTTYTPLRIVDFGFRPWRNTMRISHFSADGNLTAYGSENPELNHFVTNGEDSNIRNIGSPWIPNSGYYVGSGSDNYAYANASIDRGDFTLSAVLQLDKLDATAASFDIDNNRFGFDGNKNKFFSEGSAFGTTTHFGDITDHITPDTDFTFEVTRTGTTLSYKINHVEIWSTTYTPSRITDFGFRPWRNTMRISHFNADGNLMAYDFKNPQANEFVANGVDINLDIVGDSWTTSSSHYLVGSGEDNYAYSNKSIINGDFTISAILQLDKFDTTAASFNIDDNRFGFDGKGKQFFSEGSEFDSTTHFGDITAHITPDKDFTFKVTRRGTTLSYEINDVEVWSTTYTPSKITRFGFRPWRNTMRIASFNAVGNLEYLGPPSESQVFINGEEGYNTFRIPAIINAPNGDLLAFAEGRVNSKDDYGNIDIVMKRSTNNGVTWGNLKLIKDNGKACAGNPGPVVDMMDPKNPNGKIYLLYNTSVASESVIRAGRSIREIFYKTSIDNGLTWSEEVNITTSVSYPNEPSFPDYTDSRDWRWYAVTPGHAIQLTRSKYAGRLFIPANHSVPSDTTFAHNFYSDDHGETWQLGGIAADHTSEVQAVELTNGNVMMNMRNQVKSDHKRVVSTSSDGGATWNALLGENPLLDPGCQASIIRLTDNVNDDRNRLLFSNPASTQRKNMTIKVSYDEGQTWNDGKTIYSGTSAYSDLVIRSDKSIGLLYEKDNTTITFAYFTLGWATSYTDMLP